MDKSLQWKVLTVLGYVALLTVTLVLCAEDALPHGQMIWRLGTPL